MIEFLLQMTVRSSNLNSVRLARLGLGMLYDYKGWQPRAVEEWKSVGGAAFLQHLAKQSSRRGDDVEAVRFCRKAIAVEPEGLGGYFALASFYSSRADGTDEALKVYDQIASIAATNSFEHHLARGQACYLQRQWRQALEEFEQAIRANPNRADVHRLAALADESQGNHEGAIAHLKNALEWGSKTDWTASWNYVAIGNGYRQLGQHAEASRYYSEAAKIQPSNPGIHQGQAYLGQIYYDQGLFADAAAHFKVAAILKPDSKDYFYRLGLSYERGGNKPKAAASFRRALELDPSDKTIQARISGTPND
jgi:tetratricopeptide (TPR) repeat protein